MLENPCFMFVNEINKGTTSSESIQGDLNKFYQWSVSWDLPFNLNKRQRLTEGEENSLRHMDPPWHQDTIEQTLQARDLEIVESADFKPGLQCQKAVKKARCSRRQLKRTAGSKRSKVLLLLFKAFIRLHLECRVQA